MTYGNSNKHFGSTQKIHFVGIGGSGMSGIAEVMMNLGYEVSGSDIGQNQVIARLKKMGIKVYQEHSESNVNDVDVVVVSSAIDNDNVEVLAAHEAKIPVIPRAEMLAELMRFKKGIAVAGTHGKTTTTSMLASILAKAELDPTFVIGGILKSSGSNARLGKGEYIVVEADESDRSFLLLQPVIAVITNVEADHLEAYNDDFSELKQSFARFLHHLPFYGIAVVCIDDPALNALTQDLSRKVISYGIQENADVMADNIVQNGSYMSFDVSAKKHDCYFNISLNMPGAHNVLNALAVISVALEVGIKEHLIQSALSEFQGIERRFVKHNDITLDDGGSVCFIEDYAHHPSELRQTIKTVRSGWPASRLVLVFQPHRYTRTKFHFEDFANVLSMVDFLLITEVYPAGEKPIANADSRSLCRTIRTQGQIEPVFVSEINDIPEKLRRVLNDGDVLLACGAGNITNVVQYIVDNGLYQDARQGVGNG